MKNVKVILISAVMALLPLGTLRAQQWIAPSDVSMGHVHLNVSDVEANKKFWVAMGGTPMKLGNTIEGVKFGDVEILLNKTDPTGPAIGSVVNHIGFYVPNVVAATAKWKAAGLKTEDGHSPQQSFVYSPGDMIQIEILEMPTQTVPIVFHHVHFYVADSNAGGVPEIQAWYAKVFGAVPGKRGRNDTDIIKGGELTFTKSDTPTAPTKGRAIDHIGFQIKNLETFCKKLQANGVKLDAPYTKLPAMGISMAFITDPWGTSIELNEPLK